MKWGDYPGLSNWVQCNYEVQVEDGGKRGRIRETATGKGFNPMLLAFKMQEENKELRNGGGF